MQRVIKDIRQAGSLASFLEDANGSSAWASSLSSYNVAMGVGLHKGWAVSTYFHATVLFYIYITLSHDFCSLVIL